MNWLLNSLKIVTLNITSSEYYLFDDNGSDADISGTVPPPFNI